MRTILVDWLVEVAEEYRLHHETLFLCVDLIDKSLSKFDVPRSQLQLLGCACMLLAAKYEEIWPPTVDDFVYISDNTYTREEVLKMEQTVLKELKFCITFPTMKHFLNRLIEASVQPAEYTGTTDQHTISAAATVRAAHTNGGKCDYANDGTWSQPTALLNYARTRGIGYCKEQVESPETIEKKNKEVKMTHYLSELALLHFDMLKFSPSLKASSAIYLARATLSTERPDKYWVRLRLFVSLQICLQCNEAISHLLLLPPPPSSSERNAAALLWLFRGRAEGVREGAARAPQDRGEGQAAGDPREVLAHEDVSGRQGGGTRRSAVVSDCTACLRAVPG